MKRILCLVLLIAIPLFGQGKKKVYFVVEFSCMEINGEEYHGTPRGNRHESDAKITYEFDEPIFMVSLSDTTVYSKAKKAVITYWKNDKWHTKNVMGKIKKGIKRSSRIKEDK